MRQWAPWGLAVLALAIGFSLGRLDAPRAPSPEAFGPALEEALTNPAYFERTVQLTELLQQMDESNLEAGVAALEKHLDRTPESGIRLFVRVWSTLDLQGAYEQIMTWPTTKMKHGMTELIFVWASQDPLGARNALQGVPSDMVRESAVSSLAGGWARGGQPGLAEYLSQVPAGGLQTKLTAVAASWKLRQVGPEATLAWAEAQAAEDDSRDGFGKVAMDRAANVVAPLEPELVRRWAQRHEGQPYARHLNRELAKRWFPVDADAAMAWLASIENEEKRAELTKTGFGRWAHLDPIASEHWLTSTDLTPDHDPALIQFSEDHSSREPEKALIWAGRIQDNGLRGTAQANVLRGWLVHAPRSAESWLEGNPLPPEVVAEARRPRPRPGKRGVQPR